MCQSCLYKGRRKNTSPMNIFAKSYNNNDYTITLIEREKNVLYEIDSYLYNLNPVIVPMDASCQVRLKLALWFWRRFLNFGTFLLPILAKECGPLIEQTSTNEALCQDWNWLKLTHWFWKRRFLTVVNSYYFLIIFP